MTTATDPGTPTGTDGGTDRPGKLLVVGSGARFASRLDEAATAAGWQVRLLVPEDPMALPPTAWLHVEQRDEQHDLIEALAVADAVILLGGVGPVTAVTGDAQVLDAVLAHTRPGASLLALTSLAVFGDAGARPLTEADVPLPPDELEPARAEEIRVLTAGDWLRTVVLRAGLVYGPGGGALVQQAVDLARAGGVSRYFGRESDIIPTIHEDDLLSLVLVLLATSTATGTFHAVTGSTSVQGLAELIAARAGAARVAQWDEESMTDLLGTNAAVPRINVSSDPARSRAVRELDWEPAADPLPATLAGG